jgi:hypothetical protein
MLPKDYAAAGHEHAEEVDFVMFPAAVTAQFAPFGFRLRRRLYLCGAMSRMPYFWCRH